MNYKKAIDNLQVEVIVKSLNGESLLSQEENKIAGLFMIEVLKALEENPESANLIILGFTVSMIRLGMLIQQEYSKINSNPSYIRIERN